MFAEDSSTRDVVHAVALPRNANLDPMPINSDNEIALIKFDSSLITNIAAGYNTNQCK